MFSEFLFASEVPDINTFCPCLKKKNPNPSTFEWIFIYRDDFGVQNCTSVLEVLCSKFEQAQINIPVFDWSGKRYYYMKQKKCQVLNFQCEYWKPDFNDYPYIYLFQNIIIRMN